jgi:L-threonylcarbamoyladenylate synthase
MINALEQDKILLCSSDTVLGLFAQLSEKSKKKIDSIKKRNLKPYIVMVPCFDAITQFIDQDLSSQMLTIIKQYWPGPLTIVFKAKKDLPDWLIGVDQTIAIRIPDHAGLQAILQILGALFTTSANISDQSLPVSYAQIDPFILQQVDEVCCDPLMIYDGPASTILNFSQGSIVVIRNGSIKIDSI